MLGMEGGELSCRIRREESCIRLAVLYDAKVHEVHALPSLRAVRHPL